MARQITNTDQHARHPWPDDIYIQGGHWGVSISRDPDAPRGVGVKNTGAFFEAFPGTFLRGVGDTLADAEDKAWTAYQAMLACPAAAQGHGPFEARGYRNGAGYCTGCGTWFAGVLVPEPEPDPEPSLMAQALTDPDVAADVVAAVCEASPEARAEVEDDERGGS